MLDFKQAIVGTAVGRIAMSGRYVSNLLATAINSPEQLGTLANEHIAMLLLTRLSRPGRCFVDVGAHIGSVVAAVRDHDRSVRIVAVEAMADKVRVMRQKFPGVEFYDCAAGESDGETTFYVSRRQSAYSSLVRPSSASDMMEVTVPIKRLDGLVSAEDVDAIKIDVVGAELDVLRGSTGILARSRPTIMFESSQADDGSLDRPAKLYEWLATQNYEVIVPNRLAHNGPALSREVFLESHWYPRRTTNYFAVAKERRTEIRDRARELLGIAGS